MVRGWMLVMVVVAGCVDAAPEPVVTIDGRDARELAARAARVDDSPMTPDVCALAAALPSDNICSLMCDPDAIKVRMLDQGTPAGTCYELLCALPGLSVTVGVCLPPPP